MAEAAALVVSLTREPVSGGSDGCAEGGR
jgi:hypothetical protein